MTAPMLPTRPTTELGEVAADGRVGDSALRLRHVGFPPSTAARLAAAGFDVVGCLDLTRWLMEAL